MANPAKVALAIVLALALTAGGFVAGTQSNTTPTESVDRVLHPFGYDDAADHYQLGNRTQDCEYNQTFTGDARAVVYVCENLRHNGKENIAGLEMGNRVWVDEDGVTPAVLAHELSHAINISHSEMEAQEPDCGRAWQFHAAANAFRNISIETRGGCEVLVTPFGEYPDPEIQGGE